MNPTTQIPAATSAAAPRDILLSVRGLSKSYGGLRAVDGASLDLYQGEVVALVGDNGAGKSTFVKMLSGVMAPDAGTLALNGGEVRFASPTQAREAGIETLHQSLALVDVFNVPENIFFGRELSMRRFGVAPVLDKATMRKRTLELLQRMGANLPSIDRPVREMSDGQRQAVAIARLLLNEVHLLIMDEPMVALGVLGVLILAVLGNLLNLKGVSPFVQMVLQGGIIVIAVVVSELRQRKQ